MPRDKETVFKWLARKNPSQQRCKTILASTWRAHHRSGATAKRNKTSHPSQHATPINQIHEGHKGITKCRERAKISVWWPGLSAQIKELVENCTACSQHRQQHPEPLMPTPLPERPWKLIATDLFILKKLTYLLVADYYSRYVEVVALPKSTSSSTVIQALKTIYARHGVPDEVRSDNGPQYHSEEFAQFAKEWGFKHTTSSPRYPQANGEVERAVRTVKGILKKEKLGPNKGAVGIQIYTNSKWILTSRTPYGKKDKVNNSNHCKFTKIGTLSCYYRYINVLRGQFKKQKHS